jgi:hypothetical protein
MGAKGMATAAGTAVLLYLVLSGRLCGDAAGDGGNLDDQLISSAVSAAAEARRRRKEDARARREQRRASRTKWRWPERAPDGWGEAAALAARTVRFTWAETLGKWALGEVSFGIKHYMRQQVRVPVPAPVPPRSPAARRPLGVALSSPLCRTAVTCLFVSGFVLRQNFFPKIFHFWNSLPAWLTWM